MADLKLSVLIEVADRITGPLRKITRGLKFELPSAARIGGLALTKLTGLAVRAGAALGALGGAGFAAMTVGAIRTGAKFEQFSAVLETLEGSSAKAQASMDWVQNFAKTTPYELDEVMEAFVALRAYGIDPTDGSLRSIGDASSAMNKRLMQGVEMIADAQTGEFERMKEFGVRGSAAGNQVRMTYQKAGKEITATSSKNANDIRRNLLGIFDSRFAGAMDRQSKTFKGLWSNLMDMFTGFQKQIADAGLFDFVKGELSALLTQINIMAASGKLEAWAKQISAGLIELLKSLKDLVSKVDWVGVIRGVIDLANGFAAFMQVIGGFKGLIDGAVAGAIVWLTYAIAGLGYTIAGILGVAAGPVVAVIALIGALGVAAWYVYRNWDQIVGWLGKMWSGLVDVLAGAWRSIGSVFKKGADAVWNMLPDWFRKVLTGIGFVLRLAVGGAVGGPAGVAAAAGATAVQRPRPNVQNGRAANGQVGVDVRLHSDRPPTVSARSNSAQVPVSAAVYRGGNGD